MSEKIYLTENKDSWIEKREICDELKEIGLEKFNEMFENRPLEKSKVLLFNKDKENPEWCEEECNRYYKSYLKTPEFNKKVMKSYMFSGNDKKEINNEIPEIFMPYYNYMKNINNNYNQVVINWYDNNNHIPEHSDCDHGMIDDYKISVINLNENNDVKRIMRIVPKKDNNDYLKKETRIELENGLLLTMCGKMQLKFNHGVPKGNGKRISMTFREFK